MDTPEFQNYRGKLAAAFLVDEKKKLVLKEDTIETHYLQEREKSNRRFYIYLIAGASFITFTDLKILKLAYGQRYSLPRVGRIAAMSFMCILSAYRLSLGNQIRNLALDLGLKYEKQLLALNPELEHDRPQFLGKLEEYQSARPESGPSTVYEVSGYFDHFSVLLTRMSREDGYIRYKGREVAKVYTL